jgi:tetratricopeptide (TPR) repeat protein
MISGDFKRFSGFFFLLVSIALWNSCSNTKDTFINRTSHNLSAHYNGYYNATLKMEDAMDRLAASHVDHYDRILTVFQYADATKAKAIYPQLEDVMKRTSNVISRHTMFDKRGLENPASEHWIDDNWLLYGQAQFFKHDYFEAMETFNYVESTYKKEPGRHLASLWIAKTYLELTELREAESKLDYLRNQSDFPKKNLWELEAVNADFYLQTKNYDKAIQHLTRAASLVKDREKKIRFNYILAQLHQQKGEFKVAFNLYTKVIKMNPKYEMSFNAVLARARCYDSSSGSSENVRKELMKMQRDPKNKEFLDQIYYSLAGIAKNEGKEDEEIALLNKSIQSSTTNANQKALSYLELAKIYYGKPDYRIAQGYYDSTITNLGKDHPDYTDILAKRNSLTKLVKYMKQIETEDSLQKISKLSLEERATVVDNILLEEEQAKQKFKQEQQQSQQTNQIFDPSRQSTSNSFNNASGSNWYFYNTQAVSFGFNEFARKFGNRKLEDNWRRSKKQSILSNNEEVSTLDSTTISSIDTAGMSDEKKRREMMIRSIPSSPEAIQKSDAKIIEAYYNIGMIYREQLNDLKASAETFETLLKRYPTCKYQLQCYYQLYRTYAVLGNAAKSEYYKNIILNEHGDTEYAEIIRNPNYATESAKKKSNLDLFYEETYRKFLNGEYASVISRKTESDIQFPQNPLVSKFDMLKTLSIGRTQPLPVFEASLNDIIRNYSNDSVTVVAQDILDYIHNKQPSDNTSEIIPVQQNDTTSANSRLYTYMPDTLHYVVLIFQNIGGPLDPDKLKNKISDFDTKNFASKNLSLQDLLFDHRNKIFIIKTFVNKDDALSYSSLLYDHDDVFGNVAPEAYQLYVISVNNFAALLAEKKTADYEDFYRSFYK